MRIKDSTIEDLVLNGYWKETIEILVDCEQFTNDEATSYIRSILLSNTK